MKTAKEIFEEELSGETLDQDVVIDAIRLAQKDVVDETLNEISSIFITPVSLSKIKETLLSKIEPQKDFMQYLEKYLLTDKEIGLNKSWVHFYFKNLSYIIAKKNPYSFIPFEFKIGLLKFIYDDIFTDSIFCGIHEMIQTGKWHKKLTKICPKGFLESILEYHEKKRNKK